VERTHSRRGFLRSLCLGAAAVALRGTARTAEGKRPNVLLIYTDDQGTLDAGCYGSTDLYTPHTDALAARGVRFTQAYAHTVCCPSRALLMTGRHPQRSGVGVWQQGDMRAAKGANMFLEEVTLAEALRDAGYRTALFGKWHLGAHREHGPTKQGFDAFFGHRGGFIDNFNHHFLHGKGFHDLYEGTEEKFMKGQYFPDLVTTRAVEFVEANRDRSFFLYLAFNIPHYPEQADPKFDERTKDLPMPRRSYARMIATVDDRLGQVIGKLEELGLRDDTIIIFMSDNGYSAEDYAIRVDGHTSGLPKGHKYGANGGGGNTGKWRGHKGTLYEGGIRVPAIVSYPRRLPKGVVRDQIISAADWMPTVLDLCGVPLPKVKLDGASLLPIITGNAPSHHKVMHWQWYANWAVREGDWKLLGRRDKPVFLGSLTDEKPETKNYLKEKPGIVERLHTLHVAWEKEVAPKHPG
jgi:arylsulfatase A-like enzyme